MKGSLLTFQILDCVETHQQRLVPSYFEQRADSLEQGVQAFKDRKLRTIAIADLLWLSIR